MTGCFRARRQGILATVKHYPKMKPEEQQRYSERLVDWAKMSAEQRNAARERYKKLRSLPPEHREQIKRNWTEQHPPAKAQLDEANPIPTPNAEPASTTGQ